MEPEKQLFGDNWPIRRRVLFASLLFFAFNLGWIIIEGRDTALFAQLGLALVAGMVSLVGVYVFGAAWDDHSKRSTLAALPTPFPAQGQPASFPGHSTANPTPGAPGASRFGDTSALDERLKRL